MKEAIDKLGGEQVVMKDREKRKQLIKALRMDNLAHAPIPDTMLLEAVSAQASLISGFCLLILLAGLEC